MQSTPVNMDTGPGFLHVQAQPSAESSDTEEDPWFGLQSTPALQHEKEGGEIDEHEVRPSTPEYFGDELPDYIPSVSQPSTGEMLEDSLFSEELSRIRKKVLKGTWDSD